MGRRKDWSRMVDVVLSIDFLLLLFLKLGESE
jgi:hypothetical protein